MKQRSTRSRGKPRRPIVETLEPRILYSADFAPGLLDAAPVASSAEQRSLAPGGEFEQSADVQLQTRQHEIVFVDAATPDYQKLIDDIRANAGERNIEVVLLQANSSGIDQIADALAARKDLNAVHIVSHGADGSVRLGDGNLDFDSLLNGAAKIKGWGSALSGDRDILIYGCNVAQSEAGRSLIDALARLTGADVAASDDPTGAAGAGGDWDLEFHSGRIDTEIVFSRSVVLDWSSTLQATAAGGETRVNTTTAGSQTISPHGPQSVAMAADGSYVVVWSGQGSGDTDGVFFQRYNAAGVAQGGETRVNTTTANAQDRPSIAMDSSGNFVVVYRSNGQDGSGLGVYARRFNASGTALDANEFRVNTVTAGDQSDVAVAMNASGTFVVTWNDSNGLDGSGAGVYAQRYNAAGVAQGANFRVNETTAGDQYSDGVAVDSAGNFIITWASDDGGSWGVYYRRYESNGTALTAETQVNTSIAGAQDQSTVALDASGNFVIVWRSAGQDGSGTGVYGQRYDAAGVAQGSEFRISTTTAGDQARPRVAMDANGNFSVVWAGNGTDGSGFGLYKQDYWADGTANGGEVRVNTSTAGDQGGNAAESMGAGIAINAQGDFVVVWGGNGTQAGQVDADGVFMQRYGYLFVTTGADNAAANDGDTSSIAALLANKGTDGLISLREAITAANNTANVGGADVIRFNIAGASVQTISLSSALPSISDALILDATSQSGYAGTPLIELNGTGAGAGSSGLVLTSGASGSTIKGLAINRFGQHGININGSSNNVIAGNYVGTNAAGSAASGNLVGIFVSGTSTSNLIGGTTAAARNVISGNTVDGVQLFGAGVTGNTLSGNYIGLNAAGTAAVGNTNQGVAVFSGASNNTIGGPAGGAGNVISGNGRVGIRFNNAGTSGNVVQGNLIGTNAAGTAAIGNGQSNAAGLNAGINIESSAGSQTIGGTAPGAGNVISGNVGEGIRIVNTSAGSTVQGNYIGTDATGTAAIGNGLEGVHIESAGHTIGGATTAARNVISGNSGDGIVLLLGSADNSVIRGNYIGVDAGGTARLGNAEQGILVNVGPDNNTIDANVIGGNALGGIRIIGNGGDNTTNTTIYGNWIGTDPTGTVDLWNGNEGIAIQTGATGTVIGGTGAGQPNVIAYNEASGVAVYGSSSGARIRANAIYDNGDLGINLDSAFAGGVTANDTGDADSGGNGLQNFPVLSGTDIVGGNITIGGRLNSAASAVFDIDFYVSSTVDASGYGEGRTYIGSTSVTTNASGDAVFGVTLAAAVSAGQYITATATDASGNTSEFTLAIGTDMLIVDTTSDVSDGTTTSIAALLANRGADGRISLREAIAAANGSANGSVADRIWFDIAGAGAHTITLGSVLASISDAVILDATSQPGFGGTPVIEVLGGGDASGVGGVASAFQIGAGGAGSTIRGFAISGFSDDAIILAGGNNLIAGNYVGTNLAGTAVSATPNAEAGIRILAGSNSNTIGGASALDRNIFAGNGVGSDATDNEISLHGGSNIVIGNYIGVAADGTTVIGNLNDGIDISTGATNNVVGGLAAGEGNLIAGHIGAGVRIQNNATDTLIRGNTIWGNGQGVAISDAGSSGHLIQQNSIYGNTNLGIQLQGGTETNFVTPNDASGTWTGTDRDPDTGPNALQNFPVLNSAVTDGTSVLAVSASLDGIGGRTYRIELFSNTSADAPSGHGEGRTYLGFVNVTAAADGSASIFTTLSGVAVPLGASITATATDTTTNDTSEFAANIAATAGIPVATDDAYSVNEDAALSVGWWDSSWTRRSQITFTGNTFGGAENLTDFPVLIALNSGNIDYAQTQNQGQDLRFLDADGTPLAYEIESWNESGTSYVWVRVPQVDTTGSDSIWMYYGNAAAAAGQNAAAVWSSGYDAVYHLSDSGSTIDDATGSVDASAKNGASAAAGRIGGGRNLDGVDDYVDLGVGQPLLRAVSGTTLSAWINMDVIAAGVDQALISVSIDAGSPPTGSSRAALEISGQEVKLIGRSLDSDADAQYLLTTGSALAGLQGTWHHLTGVVNYAGDTFAIYLDGVLVQSATAPTVNFTNAATPNTNPTNAALGAADEGIGLFADGRIDEMRISGVARSAAWIRADYLSMSGSFVTLGGAQSAPATQGVLGNDSDSQNDALTATLVSAPGNAASFTLNPDGTFVYVPAANFAGTDMFTYTATDGSNTSNVATVTITVNPVNDEPSFTVLGNQTVAEDAGAQTVNGFASALSGGGADEAGQTLNYTVSNNNNALFSVQPTIDASGNLTYTAAANAFGTATVSVYVTDSGGVANGGDDTSPTQTFAITVTPVNDQPTTGGIANVTANEDAPPSIVDLFAAFADIEDADSALTYTITGNTNLGLFSATTVNGIAGTMTLSYAANASGSADITVRATDTGGQFVESTFTVTLNPVNDAPTGSIANVSVNEDAAPSVIDLFGAFSDVEDSDAALTYTITGNTNPGLFSASTIDGVAGTLTLGYAANTNGTSDITVRATDTGGQFVETTFTVTVNAVNDEPSFSLLGNQTVPEDAGAQAVNGFAGALPGGGADEAGQTFNYTVSNDNNALFLVQPTLDASGNLTYTAAANAFGTATVSVYVSDSGGVANGGDDTAPAQTFTITVASVNDQPTGSIGNVTLNEDAAPSVIDLFAAFADIEDADAALTYAIAGNTNPALFSAATIDAVAGTLTLGYPADTNGTSDVTVRATDTGGQFMEITFTVTVNAVNDEPSFTLLGNQTVAEDAGAQTVNAFATAQSGAGADESAQTFTYTVSNNNNALFTAQPTIDTNGNLTYTAAPNATGSATVSVYVTDSGGLANGGDDTSPAQTFTITVTPVNDQPTTGGIADALVNEDAAPSVIDLFAAFADAEDADAALTYTITGNTNPSLFSATTIDGVAGTLTLGYAGNASGTSDITVRATDTGGQFVEAIFTVTVNPVNDVPATIGIVNVTANEDAGPSVIDLFAAFADVEDADAALTYTITGNTNPGLFSATAVNGVAGTLTLSYAANANGTSDLTVRATDVGGEFVETTFTVTLNAVNDVPSLALGGDVSVLEDAGAQGTVGFATALPGGGADEAGQTFTYSATNDNNALFSAQPTIDASGNLTYAPAANANGVATVTVVVTDNGGVANGGVDTSSPQSFTITVVAVNDVPVLTLGANQAVNEDAGPQSVMAFATGGAGGGADETGQLLNYSVVSDNPTLFSVQPAIDVAGNLTYVAATNASGVANVTVVLSDNGGTANGGLDATAPQIFTITVNPVNDAPVLGANSLTIDQGAAVTLGPGNLSASDIDTPLASLVYSVSGVANGRFELSSAPGTAISSFTQAQLDAGQVIFVHSSAGSAPAYSMQVSDGALVDGPAPASITFGAIVIAEEPEPAEPAPEPLPPIEPIEPAAAAPEPPVEAPQAPLPPVFSPGRPDAEGNELAEAITQLKRAEARHVLVKVVQPVLSNNDYDQAPPVDPVLQLFNMTPAQLEYRASAPVDWEVAPAFAEGFQDEAQQQLQVLLDSVKFGGMALSVGVVWWASRISAMLGSLLASAPAWRHIDPLPVVGDDEQEKDKWLEPDDRDADANELAVSLVLEGGRAGAQS